jgi:signal transduction histidine kinase
MNPMQDERLIATFFDEQPQPAFYMVPVWSDDEQTIIDFEYRYCNREFFIYTGLTPEKILGNHLFNSPAISATDYRNKFLQQLTDVYQTGSKMTDKFFNPDLKKYYSFTRNKVQGGVLTVLQDRTEEYSMLKQLEEQTSFTNNILKYSSSGITVTEIIRNSNGELVDGRTILANDAAKMFLGLTDDEDYRQKTIGETDPPILSSPIYQMSKNTLETGTPFQVQYYFEPAQKWIELSVSKMDENHLINLFTDITATKEAQLQLEQAAERLQSVFNASQSGMFTFAPLKNEMGEVVDFTFVITNPSFAAYVGQTPEVLQGEKGSTWFPGYLHNGVFDMYKQTYLTGNTLRQELHYCVDGHDLYLDLLSTKVDDEVLVTFMDYTTLKKTQLQLEKLVEDLKRSNAYLEEFAHVASHDLKEPIRKIHTFSDRLKASLSDRLTQSEASIFDRMQNAAERMTLLMDDLLSYSHLSLAPKEKEEVDLNKKLRLVISDLEVLVEEKNAAIQIEPLPVIYGYKRQLQQLFQNLVGNALKYSKKGVQPQVHIRSKKVAGAEVPVKLPAEMLDQTFYLIEVEDNGIGFEQQYAERIFGMFQRLHGRSEYAGTGVGLSIGRKVVENHGGFIWAESTPGIGSTFKVLLPT